METIRYAEAKDFAKIKELAHKHAISLPQDGSYIVVENSEGEIKAFANMRGVIMIEPFISTSPQTSRKLWNYISKTSQSRGVKILRCFTQEKNVKLLSKLGFYRAFKNLIPMEINFLS